MFKNTISKKDETHWLTSNFMQKVDKTLIPIFFTITYISVYYFSNGYKTYWKSRPI